MQYHTMMIPPPPLSSTNNVNNSRRTRAELMMSAARAAAAARLPTTTRFPPSTAASILALSSLPPPPVSIPPLSTAAAIRHTSNGSLKQPNKSIFLLTKPRTNLNPTVAVSPFQQRHVTTPTAVVAPVSPTQLPATMAFLPPSSSRRPASTTTTAVANHRQQLKLEHCMKETAMTRQWIDKHIKQKKSPTSASTAPPTGSPIGGRKPALTAISPPTLPHTTTSTGKSVTAISAGVTKTKIGCHHSSMAAAGTTPIGPMRKLDALSELIIAKSKSRSRSAINIKSVVWDNLKHPGGGLQQRSISSSSSPSSSMKRTIMVSDYLRRTKRI